MKLLDFPCNSQRQAIMQIRSDDLYTDRQTIHKADRHGRSRQQWQRGEASPEQLVIVVDITVIDTQHTLLARLSLIDRKRRAGDQRSGSQSAAPRSPGSRFIRGRACLILPASRALHIEIAYRRPFDTSSVAGNFRRQSDALRERSGVDLPRDRRQSVNVVWPFEIGNLVSAHISTTYQAGGYNLLQNA